MTYIGAEPIPGLAGGTGVANTGLTINLSGGSSGYVLTSDSFGNATWQAGGGGGSVTFTGDTGTPFASSAVTIYANNTAVACGSSVLFNASTPHVTLQLTDGSNNTLLGLNAGALLNTASNCTGLGAFALSQITDDEEQVAVGIGALQEANDGIGNTAVGAYALNSLLTPGYNTCIGNRAALSLTSGNFNTILGYFSGTSYTGSESSNILLGNIGVLSESNVIRIGTQGGGALQQNACYIAGIASVSVSNTNMVTIDTTTGQLGSQAVVVGGIVTLDGDSGSATGTTVTLAGSGSVSTAASGATVTITGSGLVTANADSGSATTSSNAMSFVGGGTVTTSASGSTVTITGSASTVFPLTVVNSTPYLPNAVTEYYLSVDTSTIAITIKLPDAPATGKAYVIKDSAGDSATHNITITTVSGTDAFDGTTSVTLAQDYGAAQFIFNGADWEIF